MVTNRSINNLYSTTELLLVMCKNTHLQNPSALLPDKSLLGLILPILTLVTMTLINSVSLFLQPEIYRLQVQKKEKEH